MDLHFIDMVIDNGSQDLFQVISCLEALIQYLHKKFPQVKSLVLVSDNASVFCAGEWIPWMIKLTRKYPFLRVSRYMNTEAQTGRDMLDAHFLFLNRKVDAFVRKDKPVRYPEELFAALRDNDGVANTTTLLLSIDEDKAALYNSSKRSFNTKIKSGVRKIHDIVYDEACKQKCSGLTPLCRLYTNTGVPNSVMTAALAKKQMTASSRILFPRYACSETLAEQIVASVVENTLSSPSHSSSLTQNEGAVTMFYMPSSIGDSSMAVSIVEEPLTGAKVLEQFSSSRESFVVKTVAHASTTEPIPTTTNEPEAADVDTSEAIRCSRCSKRFSCVIAHGQHELSCADPVVRSKDQLIAEALCEFFTSSKQAFAETRARSISVSEDPIDVSDRRSRQNWAEKDTVNEFAVFTPIIRDAIQKFFVDERQVGRKVQPKDVAAHLFESVVSQTDWEAKFLLSEQRLKTELSRLATK